MHYSKARENTASELVRAYGLAYQRIQARASALTAQIDDARSKGETVSLSWLYERDRLNNLKIEIEREMRAFAKLASERVTSEQRSAISIASDDAQRLLDASERETGSVSRAVSSAGNSEAISSLAGFAGDGQPLRLLFDKIAPQMATAISDEIVSGVARKASVREIANAVRERSGIGLARALLIARQETLRVYRSVTLDAYQAPGVVQKWQWLSAQDSRVCIICLLMDGKRFPLTVPFASHVSCRCSMIPVTDATPIRQNGIERFMGLELGVQKQLLGKAKYQAFKEGRLKPSELIGVRYSPQWGAVRYEKSLKELLA